ncbi:hypothetical protein MIR68_012438 [Amoeboaphelidium protococcarum]|nr:hypothetical protein MIR68_012438 [Amoeboaphelidium protococcarum]KAI3644022.1 hypothetical protein MP228_010186 [Amoeboaphelidium protococcarum]
MHIQSVSILASLLAVFARAQEVCNYGSTDNTLVFQSGQFPATSSSATALYNISKGVGSKAEVGNAFVVAAQVSGEDSSGLGIFATVYQLDQASQTVSVLIPQFQVNSVSVFDQKIPSVAGLTNGGFVIVYQSSVALIPGSSVPRYERILFQLFDANGIALGPESLVNDDINSTRQDQYPSVAALKGDSGRNGFIVSWISYDVGTDGRIGGGKLYARIFNSDGTARSSSFNVNTLGDNVTPSQQVVGISAGFNLITWSSQYGCTASAVMARVYDSNGVPIGSPFQVNPFSEFVQINPSAAGLSNGKFVISWSSTSSDSVSRINFQLYDNNLAPQGAPIAVNPGTNLIESGPYVVQSLNQTFVVLYNTFNPSSGASAISGSSFTEGGERIGQAFVPAASSPSATQSIPVGTGLANNAVLFSWTENGDTVVSRPYQCKQDCVVSEWSEFSECSAPCGSGTQTRTRSIIRFPFLGGEACPSDLQESKACNTAPCPSAVCQNCIGNSTSPTNGTCFYKVTGDYTFQDAINACSQNCTSYDGNCLVNVDSNDTRLYLIENVIPSQPINNANVSTSSGVTQSTWINSWQGSNYGGLCLQMSQFGAITTPEEGCDAKVGAAICQVDEPSYCLQQQQ